MNRCTATTRQWPNSRVDVHPDEEAEFLAHAEDCPYHAAALRAEGEQFLSSLRKDYRLARILGRGRILEGEELAGAVASRKEESKRWREAAAKRKLPYSYIALQSNGIELARYSKLYRLSMHDGEHEIEPESLVEVWAVVVSDGRRVESRLASYDLADAGREQLIPLGGGDKAALKISECDEGKFRIEFRFVEPVGLTSEKQGGKYPESRLAPAGGAYDGRRSAKRVSPTHAPHHRDWRPALSTVHHSAVQPTLCLLLVFLLVSRVGVPRLPAALPAETSEVQQECDVKKPNAEILQAAAPATGREEAKGNRGAGSTQTPGRSLTSKEPQAKRPGKTTAVAGIDIERLTKVIKDSGERAAPTPEVAAPSLTDVASSTSNSTDQRRVSPQTPPRTSPNEQTSDIALRASPDEHTSAQQAFIAFRVVWNALPQGQWREYVLEQLRMKIQSYGRDVRSVSPKPTDAPAQELMNVELVVVAKKGNSVSMIFRTEVDGRQETLSKSTGAGDSVAEASRNALNNTPIPDVLMKINKLLKEQPAPRVSSTGNGGDLLDAWRVQRGVDDDDEDAPATAGAVGLNGEACK